MSNSLDKTSKFLSYVLRHRPDTIELILEPDGWVNIDTLITQAAHYGEPLNRVLIEQIIKSSNKQRFGISADGLKIRAMQGHSTEQVQLNHTEHLPPIYLFHGTATRFIDSIKQQGLIAGSRHYVHLSADENTAISVGQRHGKPIVLKVKALSMYQQGYKLYLADNGVWLTKTVPVEFLLFAPE